MAGRHSDMRWITTMERYPWPIHLEDWCVCGHHADRHQDDDVAYCENWTPCDCPGFTPLDWEE